LLLIRGANAAMADGPDESNLKVSCNMAQAFEIPTGNRTATKGCLKRCPPAGAI
jgi:hypothetical protein